MPKSTKRYPCSNPKCNYTNSNQNYTIAHMENSPTCLSFLSHCQYCKKYSGLNQSGLDMHYSRSKRCGDIHNYMKNPGIMDREQILTRGKILPENHSVPKAIIEHINPPTNEDFTNVNNSFSTDVLQIDGDEDDVSDFDPMDTVVRTVSTFINPSESNVRSITSTTEAYTHKPLSRTNMKIFQDLDNEADELQSLVSISSTVDDQEEEEDNMNSSSDVSSEKDNDPILMENVDASFNDTCFETSLSNYEHQLGLKEKASELLDFQKDVMLTREQIALSDLFLMLEKSGAPLNMFDRIVDWSQDNIDILQTYQVDKRAKFLTSLKRTVFPRSIKGSNFLLEPTVTKIKLPSGKLTTLTTNDFEDYIMELISPTNPLFCERNLLIDPSNPNLFIMNESDSLYYGDIHTGRWLKRAQEHNRSLGDKHILMPFCLFIDKITIDKYGKLKIEAVLCCCLWFKQECCKKASFWFNIGYIEKILGTYQKTNDDTIGKIKQMDWHFMMSHILNPSLFMGILGIQQQGGMEVDLTIGSYHHKNIILHPEIAFIICDCKGRDVFVGRHKGHSILMPGLCGDCNCKSKEASNINVSCSMRTLEPHQKKTKNDLKKESFHQIQNAFFPLNMGQSPYHIFGSCPPEILHLFELGLSEFLFEIFDDLLPPSLLEEVNEYAKCISYLARHQSNTYFPNISVFSKGLTKVHMLKAREKHARIFILYLCLLNTNCVKRILKGRKHVAGIPNQSLKVLFDVIEGTLIMHSWLNLDHIKKSHIYNLDNNDTPLAEISIKAYMRKVKSLALLTGYNLDRPKFHQLLHFVHYIREFGVPSNFDGSRCESFGKEIFKLSAIHTHGSKPSFNYDTASRIYERKIVDVASKIHLKQTGIPISKYSSHDQPTLSLSQSSCSQSITPKHVRGARFTMTFHLNVYHQQDTSVGVKNLTLQWKKKVTMARNIY